MEKKVSKDSRKTLNTIVAHEFNHSAKADTGEIEKTRNAEEERCVNAIDNIREELNFWLNILGLDTIDLRKKY